VVFRAASNPDLDLPADFEERRAENYAKLRKPLDAKRFTGDLLEEMDAELSALHDALPGLAHLQIVERKKGGAILLSPLEALPEPRNLRKLKAAVRSRWGVVPLLDMFTETARSWPPRHRRRAGVGPGAHRRRPAGPDRAVHHQHDAVRDRAVAA
jgi:hypothetical protein